MAMEEVGSGAFEVTCKLQVAGALTAAVWRTRGRDGGYFVKRLDGVVPSNAESVTVTGMEVSDTTAFGLLRSVDGPDNNLTGRVLLYGYDVTVRGSSTETPVTAAQQAGGIGFHGDGYAVLKASSGFGRVLGGTQAQMRVAFMSEIFAIGGS